MNNKIYKIYAHVNKINKKVYIGCTCCKYISTRWKRGEGYKHNQYFYNDIKKYGWDNFYHIILIDNINTSEMAYIIENELILKYNSINPNLGYNLATGGIHGKKLVKSSRNKIRLSKIGEKNPNFNKHLSEETRKKMSEIRKGKKQTEEWINKRKRCGNLNGMYGKHHTKEVIIKLSQCNKGGFNSSAKKCYLFSNVSDLKEYECLTYAYKTTGKGISYCRHHRLNGIIKESNEKIIILTEIEFNNFKKWAEINYGKIDWTDIQRRYDLYNTYFHATHNRYHNR